jgi:hypothetical protein
MVLGQSVEAVSKAAKVSDPVLLAIVGGVVTIITTIFGGVMTYLLAKIQRQGAIAAVKADEVKNTLESSSKLTDKRLDIIQGQGTAIHTLVNSSMGAQLKINVIALKRVVLSSSKEVARDLYDELIHQQDVEALGVAERLLNEHEVKQAAVDSKEKSEVTK